MFSIIFIKIRKQGLIMEIKRFNNANGYITKDTNGTSTRLTIKDNKLIS